MEVFEKDFNGYLRQYVKFLCQEVDHELDSNNLKMDSDYAKGLCFVNLLKADPSYMIKQQYGDNDLARKIICENKSQVTMMLMVLINDLYVSLSAKFATDGLSTAEEKLYDRIVQAIEEGKYTSLMCDLKTIGYFIKATTDFEDMSAYDKVFMIKTLEKEDIALLSRFNPFFKEEYDKLNVKVDKRFIMRQIIKWIKATKDTELAINETANFLCKLFNIGDDVVDVIVDIMNSNNPDEVTQAFIDEDVEQIAGYVSAFYEANKDEFLNKKK